MRTLTYTGTHTKQSVVKTITFNRHKRPHPTHTHRQTHAHKVTFNTLYLVCPSLFFLLSSSLFSSVLFPSWILLFRSSRKAPPRGSICHSRAHVAACTRFSHSSWSTTAGPGRESSIPQSKSDPLLLGIVIFFCFMFFFNFCYTESSDNLFFVVLFIRYFFILFMIFSNLGKYLLNLLYVFVDLFLYKEVPNTYISQLVFKYSFIGYHYCCYFLLEVISTVVISC